MGQVDGLILRKRRGLMNLENQRGLLLLSHHPRPHMDVTSLSSAARVPARTIQSQDATQFAGLSRHSSLSPINMVPPETSSIEQQAHNIPRQGIQPLFPFEERELGRGLAREEGPEEPGWECYRAPRLSSPNPATERTIVVGYPVTSMQPLSPTSEADPQQALRRRLRRQRCEDRPSIAGCPRDPPEGRGAIGDPRRGKRTLTGLQKTQPAHIQPRGRGQAPGSSTPATPWVASVSDVGDPQGPVSDLQHQTHALRDFASTEADEEKLDERAKLSVAAKRSLFRELEKSIDGGAPKLRSRNAAVDRRLRRTQDRSRTQPVTTEEVVIAATLQASSQQSAAAKEQAREARLVQDAQEAQGSKPMSTMEEKDQSKSQSQSQEEPDLCTLSLAEKMALFNRLAQPPTRVTRTRGDTRQRRANARYQTQPITLGDMEQESSDIDIRDEPELSDSPVEHLQLQNGTGSRFGHLPSSSSSSALRAGGTVSTDHAGDIHITRAPAQVENLPPSSDRSLPPRHPDDPAWRSQDHQRYRNLPQREDGADLGGGKRKLPSPEGAVRQAALPQPQTGRERSGEVEEVEEVEQQLSRGRGEGAVQSSESHMPLERQEQRGYLRGEGHYPDSQRSRAISGELLESTVVTSRAASGSPGTVCQPPAADSHTDNSGHITCLVQPEQEEEVSDMTARHMSIKERVALLKKSGEEDWRNRINKKQDAVRVAVGEQHAQLWEVEQSLKKKDDEALMMIDEFAVSDQLWEPVFASTFSPEPPFHTSSPDESASQATRSPRPVQVDERHPWRRKRIAEAEMESQRIEAHMSIQERKQLIVAQEEAWKTTGHGAANDSTQFTVAARMVKKGLASPTALQSPVLSKPKNSSLAISKPQEEIKAIPDLNLESDRKLDKLESFLGKLNSKVSGLPAATITVTEKKVKEVMTLEDETFSKFYRHVEELPSITNKVEIDEDFDAIFGPQEP
ncbi:supervillin, partial [Lates japonicus]